MVNTEIDVRSVIIDPHAIKRARERFNLKNDKDAMNTCKSILGAGRFISEITCERGNKGYLYAAGKKGIVVSLDYSVIRTAMDFKKGYVADVAETNNPLHLKLVNLYDTEIRKYNRRETTLQKRLNEVRMVNAVELAQLNLRLHKTRSELVRAKVNNRIKEINNSAFIIEYELVKLQSEKRIVVKSRACLT